MVVKPYLSLRQRTNGLITIVLLLLLTPCATASAQQVFSEQGVSIEFSTATKPVAGEETTVTFKIKGTSGNVPLSNLRPVAWIDQRQSPQQTPLLGCKDKVQAFL